MTCSRSVRVAVALRAIVGFAVVVCCRTAFASDPLDHARSPLYRSTLVHALQALDGAHDDAIPAPAQAAASAAAGGADIQGTGRDHILVTQVPNTQTICSGTNTVICTANPATTTQCPAQSNTYCAADPNCGFTSQPAGRVTLCRGEATMCKGQEVVQCTLAPGVPTNCPVSRTFCPGRTPGQGDANCFTFIPGGGAVTLCANPNGQGGAQTACNNGRLVICTRDPGATTQCTNSSRTACPTDPSCRVPIVPPPCRPSCEHLAPISAPASVLEPSSAAAGATASIGIFCFDVFLVQGEMHAWFGADINVLDYTVTSSVESNAQISVHTNAILGPRLVFLHAGDEPTVSPDTWGEYVIAVGPFTVTQATDVVGPAQGAFVRLRTAPNPFTERTNIEYEVAQPGEIDLRVFDGRGRLVREIEKRVITTGTHTTHWDGFDDRGRRAPGGVYFLVAEMPNRQAAAWKIVLQSR